MPPPRLVDWTVLALVAGAALTGLWGLLVGEPGGWWVVAAHGAVGLAVPVALYWKLRRVTHRLRAPDRRSVAPLAAAALVVLALATGAAWATGWTPWIGPWPLLMVHMVAGLLAVVPVVVHLADRFRLPRRTDLSRRAALEYAALAGGGVFAWRAQRALARALGATGRFTGSSDAGGEGNDFPVTSWVADDPDPLDAEAWRLRVDGAVAEPLELAYGDVGAAASERATLDCTSGWYADREWAGVRVGDLLDRADAAESARYVAFHSVTGYRWSLPVGEARAALLATAVGGEQLTHGHGFPARLVAPGRRGFQWVKWVERVEVRETPDYGQWVAIFTSGFD